MAAPAAPIGPGSGRPLAALRRSQRRRQVLAAIIVSVLATALVATAAFVLHPGNLERSLIIGSVAGLIVAQLRAAPRP